MTERLRRLWRLLRRTPMKAPKERQRLMEAIRKETDRCKRARKVKEE